MNNVTLIIRKKSTILVHGCRLVLENTALSSFSFM